MSRPRAFRIAIAFGLASLLPHIGVAGGPADGATATHAVLNRSITLNVSDVRLADVISFVSQVTGARFEPMWFDGEHVRGLDPDAIISVSLDGVALSDGLDRILAAAAIGDGSSDKATWQLAPTGEIELGPRSRLNEHRILTIYDLRDLDIRVINFPNVPRMDLQGALNPDSGAPFQAQTDESPIGVPDDEDQPSTPEEILDLLTTFIEPDQWESRGGAGATARIFQGQLIVAAPAYIHRQIAGLQ